LRVGIALAAAGQKYRHARSQQADGGAPQENEPRDAALQQSHAVRRVAKRAFFIFL
jgi:hypothetical protein